MAYYRAINGGKYVSNILPEGIKETKTIKNTEFNKVSPEIKEVLIERGWTEDKWDSVSEDERQHAIKCYGI